MIYYLIKIALIDWYNLSNCNKDDTQVRVTLSLYNVSI